MKSLKNFVDAVIITLAASSVASCGGGGGGGSQAAPSTQPVPAQQFAEVTAGSGIGFAVGYSENPGDVFDIQHFSGGAAAGDYDNDGDIDLFVVRGDVGPNLLYRNDGDNVFTDVATAAGVAFTKSATENYRHSGPMFADMDGDGDLDLYIGGVQGDPCRVFANNGDGTFSDVTAGSGLDGIGAQQNVSAAFGDYDLDGDLDMLTAHWGTPRSSSNPGDTEHLWRNESTGGQIRFVSSSIEAGISPSIITLPDPRVVSSNADRTFAPAFVHLNDDLYPDIVMASDFNTSMVFMNNQDATFTNTTDVDVITETNGMGSAVGDYDNDGDMDWFVTSIYRQSGGAVPNGNRLYRNDGGQFVDVTEAAGVADGGWGWAACFVDLDNDGNLDIYHTNGWEFDISADFASDTSRAFMSDGSGVFVNRANALGIADSDQGRGAVCADFDGDRDVDIFLWSNNATNGGRLFRNDSVMGNAVVVRLNGLAPNTQAVGARIRATVGTVTQLREVSLGSNFISQNSTEQVIGVGSSAQVDSLIVEWPDGQQSDLGIVQVNQTIVVNHPGL
ncbi:MAG: CRTAC1 family protein [Woeseiaceae bacterium]